VTGADIYPYRSDLDDKQFWRCRPCKAWVGCHGNSSNPMGRLANSELRGWKVRAHAAFDPLWMRKRKREQISKKAARNAGYAWLAKELGIPRDQCHIGLFDVDACKRVIELCQPKPRGLEAPAPSAEPQPPSIPMLRVGHIRGRGFHGYIYRGAFNERLTRIDTYTKKPRIVTSTWLVDDVQVDSLDEALAQLQPKTTTQTAEAS
jgi:hypothetical protein